MTYRAPPVLKIVVGSKVNASLYITKLTAVNEEAFHSVACVTVMHFRYSMHIDSPPSIFCNHFTSTGFQSTWGLVLGCQTGVHNRLRALLKDPKVTASQGI